MRDNSTRTWPAAVAWVVLTLWSSSPALGQDARGGQDAHEALDDATGREIFERGRAAFEQADYESALRHFREAYRLSLRGELQYNIGVAAARLQREQEALEAFERYLQDTEQPTRRVEVLERIEALRQSIAEQEATKLALEEAASVVYRAPAGEPTDRARLPTSTIAGGTALGAVGAAGLVAMTVGLAKSGSCTEEVAGSCVTEQSKTAWTWVYGGLGAASLVGSATWFAISARRTREGRPTRWSLSPMGIMVSRKF